MPRKKGTPKTGGRQKGTPNHNPLKLILRDHSFDYFEPILQAEDCSEFRDDKGNIPDRFRGKTVSQFDADCYLMKPADRAKLEVDLLAYHTAKMQAISAEMDVQTHVSPFTERLTRLVNGEDITSDEE